MRMSRQRSEEEKGAESEVDTDLDVTYTIVDGHVPFTRAPRVPKFHGSNLEFQRHYLN